MKNNETGHAKNVANLGLLIQYCQTMGASYNPSKENIQLGPLHNLKAKADTELQAISAETAAFNSAIDARILIFSPLRPLSTRILSAFQATNASKEAIQNVKSLNRKIQGRRATPISSPAPDTQETESPKNISAAQLSFDQQIQHLSDLLELLKVEDSYAPNEGDLKVENLESLKQMMTTSNNNAQTAYALLSSKRIARNKTLYDPETGIVALSLDVKNYVKSVFGSKSAEYKQISGIQFKTVNT
ncbi:MAG: hypothetical protein V4561_06365 [Bacteroidota bacterium]